MYLYMAPSLVVNRLEWNIENNSVAHQENHKQRYEDKNIDMMWFSEFAYIHGKVNSFPLYL